VAKVVDKRPNGVVLVEVPAEDAADLEIGADVEVRRSPSDRLTSGLSRSVRSPASCPRSRSRTSRRRGVRHRRAGCP